MKEKLLEEFRRYVDHYDNMQGLLIVRIAEKDIESIIDQAYEAGRESVKEDVMKCVPKHMGVEDCTCFISAPCSKCEYEVEYDVGRRDGYKECRNAIIANLEALFKKN